MTTQHTPGPWKIGEITGGQDGGIWAEIDGQGHSGIAQVVWKMEDDERTPRCEANARLIAAAPDLLEALQQISDYARTDGDIIAQHLAGIARAAIAKTTGEKA